MTGKGARGVESRGPARGPCRRVPTGHTPDPSPEVIGHGDAPDRTRPLLGHGWGLAGLRVAWARFERGAAEPAARCRPWGQPTGGRRAGRDGCRPAPPGHRALGGPDLATARANRRRPGNDRSIRRVAGGDALSSARRNPRGGRPHHRGHGGLVAAGAPAPGRLAVVERPRAPRGARARTGSHHPGRLRGRACWPGSPWR